MNLDELSRQKYGRSLAELDDATVYQLLMSVVSEKSAELPLNAGKKRLYYISAEFLIGKLLTNNLINLGLYDEAKRQLAEAGHDLNKVEENDVWPHALSIPWQHWGFPEMVWASITTLAFSTRSL